MSSSTETIVRRRIAGERRRPPADVRTAKRTANAVAAPNIPRHDRSQPGREAEVEEVVAERSTSSWRWPVAALVAAAIALAAVLGLTLREPAVTAADETAAVAAAQTGLEQILSYDAASVAGQPAKVSGLLTGQFKEEFGATFSADIAPLAKKNGAVVKAQVREIGVASRGDETVTVQAFVNQTRTTTADPSPAIDQNRVIATMTRVDGRWLISQLAAY